MAQTQTFTDTIFEKKLSEYETIGDRTTDAYDNLEMQQHVVQVDAKVESDEEKHADKKHKTCLKKNVCIGILIAVIIVLVIVIAVIVYVFLYSETQDGSCKTNTYIRNGQIIRSTGSRHGDTLEIQCDKNSKLNGTNTITCLSSGVWSTDTQCIPKECWKFVLTQHMAANSNTNLTTVGSIISLICEKGFNLSGNSSVICQANEEWSEIPICTQVDCGPPKLITNSKQLFLEKTSYNSSFTVECVDGYALIGTETVKCNLDGQWDILPVCEIVSCGVPNIPAHASIKIMTGTTFQSNVSLKCDDGYSMHGNPVVSCLGSGHWTAGPTCKIEALASDCYDIYKKNIGNTSGVYSVKLWKTKQIIDVYCDMDTHPYGWTVFQKRFDGSVDFYRNFSEYTNGFGTLQGEVWLGLLYIEEMASQYESEIRLDITAADNSHVYEVFQNFSLSKYPNFTLFLGKQTVEQIANNPYGFSYNNGSDFSTFDHDAEQDYRNCAEVQHGGWWYVDCAQSNLNGEYVIPPGGRSVYDNGWGGFIYHAWKFLETLKSSQIMFRKITESHAK